MGTSMGRIGLLLLGGVVVAGAMGGFIGYMDYTHRHVPPVVPPPAHGRVPPPPGKVERGLALAKSTKEMRRTLDDAYRLGPDARFVSALTDVERLLTGSSGPDPKAVFTGTEWRITRGATVIGALPELADLPDALAMLDARITELAPPGKPFSAKKADRAADASTDEPLVELDSALAQLPSLDAQWRAGAPDAATVLSTWRALLSIAVETPDLLGVGDGIGSNALAVLALARRSGVTSGSTEALFADALGYGAAAKQVAATLPDGDAVRAFIEQNDEVLSRAASASGSFTARYLWLRRLVWRDEHRAEQTWRAKQFAGQEAALWMLATRLRGFDFGDRSMLGSAGPPLIVLATAIAAGQVTPATVKPDPSIELAALRAGTTLGLLPGSIPARFDDALGKLVASYGKDSRLGSAVHSACLQSLMYSAFGDAAFFAADQLGSAPAAHRLAESLGESSSPAFKAFRRWLEVITQAMTRDVGVGTVTAAVDGIRPLGDGALRRLYDSVNETADWDDPRYATVAKRFAARYDARPADRYAFGNVVYGLRDPVLYEKYYTSALAADPGRYAATELWWARAVDDTAKLRKWIASPLLRSDARGDAIEYLEKKGALTHAEAEAAFARSLDPSRDDWSDRHAFVKYLDDHKEYEEARKVIDDWVRGRQVDSGFHAIYADVARSWSFYKEGLYAESWKAVEPSVGSMAAGPLERGALALARLGKGDRAIDLARSAVTRYPQAAVNAIVLAEVYWILGRDADAGIALRDCPMLENLNVRVEVGKRMMDALSAQPDSRVIEAIDRTDVPSADRCDLMDAVHDAGNDRLAFQVAEKLLSERPGRPMRLLISGYEFLRALKGEVEATAWIDRGLGANDRLRMTMASWAYDHGDDSLLWTVAPRVTPPGDEGEFLWLMRAAASVRSRDPDPQHLAQMKAYFSHSSGYAAKVGRRLLGMTTDEDVLSSLANVHRECEAGYYLGLVAESEGRLVDAVTWYRASVETASKADAEYRWASLRLRALTGVTTLARREADLKAASAASATGRNVARTTLPEVRKP